MFPNAALLLLGHSIGKAPAGPTMWICGGFGGQDSERLRQAFGLPPVFLCGKRLATFGLRRFKSSRDQSSSLKLHTTLQTYVN